MRKVAGRTEWLGVDECDHRKEEIQVKITRGGPDWFRVVWLRGPW